jgi:hypothetical protein
MKNRHLGFTGFTGFAAAAVSLLVAVLLLSTGGPGGCSGGAGASSPPVGIPAPVAGLISTTSPDAAGKSRLIGAPGAVEGGAALQVSKSSTSLATATANGDGSFDVEFPAALGDTIDLAQMEGSTVGDPAAFEIIPGRTPTAAVPFGPGFAPSFGDGCIAGVFGSDTDVECFSPSTFALTAQFFVTGFQADDLALDDSSGDFYLIDRATDQVVVRDSVGGARGGAISVTRPLAVSADLTNQFAVVAQENAFPSLTMIDDGGSFPGQDASTSLTHPTDGTAVPVSNFEVSLQQDGSSQSWMAVLTDFDNGDTVLSVINLTPPPGGGFSVTDQINLGPGSYGGVVLFNGATDILVSDSGRDQVIRFNGPGFGNFVIYPVGRDPRGVAVSESVQGAFVCNHDDHTISIIDLSNDTVVGVMPTGLGVGLGPVGIAINESPFTGLVANDIDQTVSIFFVQDVLTALGF